MKIWKKIFSGRKRLKIIWKELKGWSTRKKILVFSLGAISLIAASFLINFFSQLLFLSRAEIGLARLEESFRQDEACHEECSAKRQEWIETISAALKDGHRTRRLDKIMARLFLDRRKSQDMKLAIIDIYRLSSDGSVPSFLAGYLLDPQSDPDLQSRILFSFTPSTLIASGAVFGSNGGDDYPVGYYLNIIASGSSEGLKTAAVSALSSYPGKEEMLTIEQVEMLKIVTLSASDSTLRHSLILFLSDYYDRFPEAVQRILEEVYDKDSKMDSISRLFAADVLNRYRSQPLPLPSVSQAEWDEYYNN